MAKGTSTMEVEGRQLSVSSLDKVLYPADGFTKGQLIDYYVRVAPVLLPHLRGRPLTMKRYPNGVEGMFFYEKNCPTHRPDWVQTAPIWSEGNNRWMDYCLVQDVATLAWAANLADIELHTSLSLAKDMSQPTMMVFDLDPGPPATILQCCVAHTGTSRCFAAGDLGGGCGLSKEKGPGAAGFYCRSGAEACRNIWRSLCSGDKAQAEITQTQRHRLWTATRNYSFPKEDRSLTFLERVSKISAR